jgi:hypothetical protein
MSWAATGGIQGPPGFNHFIWPEQSIVDIARWLLLISSPAIKPSMVLDGSKLLYVYSKKIERVFDSGCIVISEET